MNILIIGGTSGIGRELGLQYAETGHHVFITGRRQALLNELAATDSNIIAKRMDISCQESLAAELTCVCDMAKSIDLAIVCAGIGDLNPELCHKVNADTLQTNVVGWTTAVDWLYNRFEQQGHGHLVLITSLNCLRGEPLAPAYSASKAFQSNYAEALCKKTFKRGGKIQVTEIRPGLVDTAMAKGEGLFWVMPVKKVAQQIRNAISKKARVQTVTRRWRIVAFIMKHLPWCVYRRM